jgi:hypothetical protein
VVKDLGQAAGEMAAVKLVERQLEEVEPVLLKASAVERRQVEAVVKHQLQLVVGVEHQLLEVLDLWQILEPLA